MNIRKVPFLFILVFFSMLTIFSLTTGVGATVLPEAAHLVADIAEQVSPSVVYIDTVRYRTTRFRSPLSPFFDDPFFRRFFDVPQEEAPRRIPQRGLGSGFIFREDGYIITNHHVIQDAEEINVTLLDGRLYTGRVIGADPLTDLAVVKIDSDETLPTVTLGDSDATRVGESVIAIGNPFGLSHSVTTGVLSAKGRPITAGDTGREYENFLQTDAAINPGNSGGPLLNLQGEVIGINTAIIPFAQGVGFAIPINMAKALLDDLIEVGRVIRAWLGVFIQDVTPQIAEQFGLEEARGALISDVSPESPAAMAGIQRGDIILRIDDVLIDSVWALQQTIRDHRPGNRVTIELWRDKTLLNFEVVLEELEQEIALPPVVEPMVNLGLEIAAITPELVNQFALQVNLGLVVVSIQPGGPAEAVGLAPGDILLEVNRQTVQTLDEWREALTGIAPGDTILLL
ncbi:MAG TPA: Do family serine endopeptidase, partial [Atribacteraceae bacterium]|nr:Do family serine endopeptidase [Atribacteraceae bacterium]